MSPAQVVLQTPLPWLRMSSPEAAIDDCMWKNHHQQQLLALFRKMVEAGVPAAAVEQRAAMEGLKISEVLGAVDSEASSRSIKTAETKESKAKGIPPKFVKKYRRMLSRDVPLKGVQGQAFVDGGWCPEEVLEVISDLMDETKDPALEQDQYQTRAPRRFFLVRKKSDSEGNRDEANGTTILFPHGSFLGSLVRNLTSIHAAAFRGGKNNNVEVQVPIQKLYDDLGALQGVQWARNRYNCTIGSKNRLSESMIRFQRQPFVEIAKTLSMPLPVELSSTATTTINIPGLDALISFLQNNFADEIYDIQSLHQSGFYEFASLSALYSPGAKVLAKDIGGCGIDMICQVMWSRYEQGFTSMGQHQTCFHLGLQFLVMVGRQADTAMAEVVERIESFEGRNKILESLRFIPLWAFSDDEGGMLVQRYRKRGELYNRLAALENSFGYMSYDQGCFHLKSSGGGGSGRNFSNSTLVALANAGRVILDTQGAYDHGHSLSIGYDPMVTGIKYKYKDYNVQLRATKQRRDSSNAGAGTSAVEKPGGLISFEKVPEEYLDMVWPFLIGFSLTSKGWGDIYVDGLHEIEWKEDIFDRLVLPEKRKTMIKALVRHNNDSFHDLVEGKGEGTIFLLYGPPGCGKKLTAEAVAEFLHKPLYPLSLGMLGSTAADLEARLGEVMTLVSRWDAIILLDEADSFLETRSSSSIERNAMVSVMLRIVEYFSGIMFLTSNRIESLDPAFQTRITLALHYEELDSKSRAQVWKNILIKSGMEAMLLDGSIDPNILASWVNLNGREIKNALRFAMAMGAEKNEAVCQNMLLDCIEIIVENKVLMYNKEIKSKKSARDRLSFFRKMKK